MSIADALKLLQPYFKPSILQNPLWQHARNTKLSHWQLEKSWWRHQMETFSALLGICAGNSPNPVNSPRRGKWRGAFMFSLICAWIDDWVNNREAGDLRRHRGHYDVNVMILLRYLYMEQPCLIPSRWIHSRNSQEICTRLALRNAILLLVINRRHSELQMYKIDRIKFYIVELFIVNQRCSHCVRPFSV